MKAYLEDKRVYVRNEDGVLFRVESIEAYDGYDTLHINLTMVDNENESDTVIQYFIKESMIDALEGNGYTIEPDFGA